MKRARLAVLASHPIPYQAPLFAELAKSPSLDLMVFYGDDYGLRPRQSAWGVDDFVWQGDLTRGYPHVFLPNRSPWPSPSTILGKLNPSLLPELSAFRPDAILLSGYVSPYQWQGFLGSGLLGARLLYFADSSAEPSGGARGLAKRAFLGAFYRGIDAFLTIGDKNRRHYLAYGVPERKLFAFPYSVGNARFRARANELRAERSDLRRMFGIPEDATCVIYIGRLSPEKNIGALIHGISSSRDTFLLVVGSGPLQSELEAQARNLLPERHRFTGFLNQDRLGEAYTAADIMALPSSYEPWGLVCNEAMNFGLPLVVSDKVGAGPDLVVPGQTGFVYPVHDIEALARAIEDTRALLVKDRAAVERAVLDRVDLYSEEAQARGVFAALEALL